MNKSVEMPSMVWNRHPSGLVTAPMCSLVLHLRTWVSKVIAFEQGLSDYRFFRFEPNSWKSRPLFHSLLNYTLHVLTVAHLGTRTSQQLKDQASSHVAGIHWNQCGSVGYMNMLLLLCCMTMFRLLCVFKLCFGNSLPAWSKDSRRHKRKWLWEI